MNVIEALKYRKSARAFLQQEVEKEKILRVLEAARYSPSGTNSQPWQVAVVTGEKKRALGQKMEAAFAEIGGEQMEYDYGPEKWPLTYTKRRVQCGIQLYGALGIERKDKERRLQQWMSNYHAFDAPVVMFFFVSSELRIGAYLDYGMFLQSIMLAAVEEGLSTCTAAALGHFPNVVKEELGYDNKWVLVCGMAMGYEDIAAPVNQFRTEREKVEDFTRFFE